MELGEMSKTHPFIPIQPSKAQGKLTATLFGRLRQLMNQKPLRVPDDQAWFWSEEWQTMEAKAQADIEAGRISKPFTNTDELKASLDA